MNQGGRIVLLTIAVVLLIIGVVCLKQRLGYEQTPPVFVPGDVTSKNGTDKRLTHEPTILNTAPNSETRDSHQPWHDPDLLPASSLTPPTLESTYPVHKDVPVHNDAPLPPENLKPGGERSPSQPEAPFGANTPSPESAIPLSPPVAEPLPNLGPPPVVITKQDDSLWTISEQVYGQGTYYRALFAANKDRIPRPDRIEAGIELYTPPREELRQLYPEFCPDSRDQGS